MKRNNIVRSVVVGFVVIDTCERDGTRSVRAVPLTITPGSVGDDLMRLRLDDEVKGVITAPTGLVAVFEVEEDGTHTAAGYEFSDGAKTGVATREQVNIVRLVVVGFAVEEMYMEDGTRNVGVVPLTIMGSEEVDDSMYIRSGGVVIGTITSPPGIVAIFETEEDGNEQHIGYEFADGIKMEV